MKNITVSISDTAYLRARVWAAERETSISAVVAYLLETLPKITRANAHYPQRTETPPATSGNPPSRSPAPSLPCSPAPCPTPSPSPSPLPPPPLQ